MHEWGDGGLCGPSFDEFGRSMRSALDVFYPRLPLAKKNKARMNHDFVTQRPARDRCVRARSLLQQVSVILSISAEDHELLKRRREPEIRSEPVVMALKACAQRLGLALEDLASLTPRALALCKAHGPLWERFLSERDGDVSTLKADLDKLDGELALDETSAAATEMDDWSSTCSDYSDSDTCSTRSTSSHRTSSTLTDSESSESSDEGEGEQPGEQERKPPARRGRSGDVDDASTGNDEDGKGAKGKGGKGKGGRGRGRGRGAPARGDQSARALPAT